MAAAATDAPSADMKYKTKEMVHEAFGSFLMSENSGEKRFAFKFLHMEWEIVVHYDQVRNSLSCGTSVTLRTADQSTTKASVLIKLITAKRAAMPIDDWGGAVDADVIVRCTAVCFDSGQPRACQPVTKKTSPLIGTTVVLEAEFRVYDVVLPAPPAPPLVEVSVWQKAIRSLLFSQSGSDVVLVADGTDFPAHWFVLTVRSQYFSGHLTHDPQSRIQLNATAGAAKELIRFLYTDEVQRMDDVAHELLQLADYYLIPDLVQKCADFLILNLNAHNVVKVIDYANRAGLQELEHAAVRSFIKHVHDCDWKLQFAALSIPAQLIIRKLVSLIGQENGVKQVSGGDQRRVPKSIPFARS